MFVGWKNANLNLFQLQKMFWKLSSQQTLIPSQLFTFPETNTLSLSLLASFFSNSIALHNINHAFKFALQESINLFFPAKYFSK